MPSRMNLGTNMRSFFKPRFILPLLFLGYGVSALSAQTIPARFSSDVYASDRVFGQANAWLPLSGNTQQALYLNPQVAYGADGQGYLDLGLGYRWLYNQDTLLGTYLFGGYSKIARDQDVWVINPGLEVLDRRWDARVNGYFAIQKNQDLGYWFGYQIGRKNLHFNGYRVYDDLYFIRQHQGHGVDARVGYQPWDQVPLKASLGSYFFAPDKVKNIVGGVAELEYWLDQHFKLLVSYNYDNTRHSIGSIGLGIELGGTRRRRTVPHCVQERLTDPIERNLAQQGQGSGVMSKYTGYFKGVYPLTRDEYDDANNGGGGGPDPGDPDPTPPPDPPPDPPPGEIQSLVYFSVNGQPNDGSAWTLSSNRCTVEAPCGPNDFTQANVNAFAAELPNTAIYFYQGTYLIHGVTVINPLALVAGQGVYGRTIDYLNPAPPADRPTFRGTLLLNTENTVSDVKIIYPGGLSPTTGINLAQGAIDIVIENSQVGSESDPTQRFNIGIGSAGSGPFNNEAILENVTIFAGNTGINFGGPSLLVTESEINAGGGSASESSGVRSTGQNATIQLDNVNINVNSSTASSLYGLQAGFAGTTMTANNVIMELNASAVGAGASALYVGFTNSGNPTNLTVNFPEITSRSVSGSAFIANSLGTTGNVSVIEINGGVLDADAPTADIQNPVSILELSIDNLSRCSIGGFSIPCP